MVYRPRSWPLWAPPRQVFACVFCPPEAIRAVTYHSTPRSAGPFLAFCQPVRQMLLYFLPVLPQQTLSIEHTGPLLGRIPRRSFPPRLPVQLVQAVRQQPQQGQRHEQRLRGPLDGVLGPGPALLPAQTLLEVAETIFLAEAGAEHGH